MSQHNSDRTGGAVPALLRLDPLRVDPAGLLPARAILRQGGLIAYPTETLYGLGVDPWNAAAVARLLAAKERGAERGLILLAASTDAAADVCDAGGVIGDWKRRLALAFWPGPLSLVLPVGGSVARCPAVAGRASVAVRVSSHPVARLLSAMAGGTITSTSANRSGRAPAASTEAIDPEVAARLDMIIDAGPAPGGRPSTLLDLTASRPTILRAGQVSPEAIAAVLGFPPAVSPGAGT